MNANEIRYQYTEDEKTFRNGISSVQHSPIFEGNREPLIDRLCGTELVSAIYRVGGEIAAQLAELREVTMEKTGTIRVPDAQRGRVHLGTLGGELRCTSCGNVDRLTPDEIEDYAVEGWPYCCGLQMLWFTRKEIEQEERQRAEAYPPSDRSQSQ